MLCIVSVVDSVSPTSMPINEFVLYRHTHDTTAKQVLIVCAPSASAGVALPDDLTVYYTENSLKMLRGTVKKIMAECRENGDRAVFHLHHIKSAARFFVACYGLGVRKQSLFTVHSTFNKRDLKYKLVSTFCVLCARRVTCVSHAAYLGYNPVLKALKGKSMFAVPNGVDTERIDRALTAESSGHTPTYDSKRKTLICVGRMIPLKNHAFLIRLLAKLPEHTLLLVGAEDSEGKIRALAKEYGVFDRVRFLGLIPRAEVFRTLTQAGIYLSSSLVEGLPVSVLEAMRAGLLPILSDIPPHAEIAAHCDGVCVLPLDETKWADKIGEYTALAESAAKERAAALSAAVENEYSLKKMHAAYDVHYRALAAKQRK